jgi:hypothetical protein
MPMIWTAAKAGNCSGDEDTNGGDRQNGAPDLLQDTQFQACAAVEEDVAGAEDQNDLIENGIGTHVKHPGQFRAEQNSGNKEEDHVREPEFPGHDPAQCAGGKNDPEHEEDMIR